MHYPPLISQNRTSPLVSVIVPVYNVERTVAACLGSVASQELPPGIHIECLVVDDCGSDTSMDAVRQWVAAYSGHVQVRLLAHERNMGLSEARNTGIRAARGRWVTFLDSDDILLPGAIANMLAVAASYPGAQIVQGPVKVNRPSEGMGFLNVSPAQLPDYIDRPVELLEAYFTLVPMTAVARLVRRSFIERHGLYFTPGMVHEDDMWRVLSSRHLQRMAFCFVPVYQYNMALEGTIMSASDRTPSYLGRMRIAAELCTLWADTGAWPYLADLLRILDVNQKPGVWAMVADKDAARKAAGRLLAHARGVEATAARHPCGWLPVFLAWYNTLPAPVRFNPFMSKIYSMVTVRALGAVRGRR